MAVVTTPQARQARSRPACLMLALALAVAAEPAEVRFDFETGDLQGWAVVEGRFPALLTDRDQFHHGQGPYNKQGQWFLSTLEQADGRPSDSHLGVVESPMVRLLGPEVSLLVGGGKHREIYLALCTVDGREHHHARGDNSQVMARRTWSAPELVGQLVFFRLVDDHAGGWGHLTVDDIALTGELDLPATTAYRAAREPWLPKLRRAGLPPAATPESLRAAVHSLAEVIGEAFPASANLAAIGELDRLTGEARAVALETMARRLLTADPRVGDHEILFVVRQQYRPDHHNTATLFQTGEINTGSFTPGSALKAIDPRSGAVRTIVDCPTGVVRDPEVHFGGDRIIFSMRRDPADDYHLYEVNRDGSGLRQLTSAPRVSDIDPLYLPDDTIVFASTRQPKYCMCNRHIMANLYRCESDGANIHPIGRSTLFEGHPTLLPDGRILYDRWEYVDRNFGDAQGLWTVNPDGTDHAVYFGNNLNSPGGVIDARAIPETELVLAVLGSCHDRPWGALGIIDRTRGLDSPAAVLRTWPASAAALVGVGNWDAFLPVRPRYEDPYPLAPGLFLCARQVGGDEQMGIYLVDLHGNEVLLHTEAPGCYDPMPLAPRPRPPVVPIRREPADDEGSFYVLDVYDGTHLAGVQRGEVKWLRVVESPEKRTWSPAGYAGQGTAAPAMNWHDFNNKRILGTVPVEPDGSAYFALPANTFVYFQLLDERGRMIQSMRSGTMVQPGEHAGCGGCHEDRLATPAPRRLPLAMQRPPDRLTGWRGEPRLFSYQAEVQPVFDRHCVRCHDFGRAAGEKLVLAGDRGLVFAASYNELWRKRLVQVVGAGPAAIQPARSWGSAVSRLLATVSQPHQGVTLDAEELDRLTTWIDLNAPYYPTYACAYPTNLAGRCPLSPSEVARLSELTGLELTRQANHSTNLGPQVSFDRPASSPCLTGLPADRRAAALALIETGASRLAERPEADQAGFEPCPADLERLRHAEHRAAEEARFRRGIASGERVYDPR